MAAMEPFNAGDAVMIAKKHSSKMGMHATVLNPDFSEGDEVHMVEVQRADGQISIYRPADLVHAQEGNEV